MAASLSNLADLLWEEGADADAKAHHERALGIRERTIRAAAEDPLRLRHESPRRSSRLTGAAIRRGTTPGPKTIH